MTSAPPTILGPGISGDPAAEPDLGRREYVRSVRRIILVLIGIGLATRFVSFGIGSPIWGDEAMLGLNIQARSYAELTQALDWAQVAPVLFLWVERAALDLFGSSEWSMRLLPFLAGCAGFLLFWDFARRVVTPTAAALAIGTLAIANWPVSMAGTLKPYSSDLFWSALLVALAARWQHRPERLWPLAALVLVVPFALFGSYPSVFVAGGVALYLLPAIWRSTDRRAFTLYVLYAASMLGAFIAVYSLVHTQQSEMRGALTTDFMRTYWADAFPPADPGRFLLWFLEIHTGRMMAYPFGDAHGGSTLSFALFLFGAWSCWRAGRKSLVLLCLTPFALNFVAAAMGSFPYGGCCRLSQHLAPATVLMIGVGAGQLLERYAPRLQVRLKRLTIVTVVFAALGFVRIGIDALVPTRDDSSKWTQRLGREVARNQRPGDRIIVRSDSAIRDASFEWYMARSGGKLNEEQPEPIGSEVRRIWVVVLGTNVIEPTEERKVLTALGTGWQALDRVEYRHQSDRKLPVLLHCTILCLARTGDPVERPILQASP